MAVETSLAKITGNGNGVARTFSFSPMVIFESSDLYVIKTDAAGNETVLAEGVTDTTYSVSVTTYPGTGSIDYPATGGTLLATGETITMKRVLVHEQTLVLENQGGYHPDLQEAALDKLVMLSIQQQETIDRSLQFPLSYAGAISPYTTAPAAGQYLRVNSAGTAMEWAVLGSVGVIAAYSGVPAGVSLVAGIPGVSTDYARGDHTHELSTVPITHGGTGATTAAAARTALGSTTVGDAVYVAASAAAARTALELTKGVADGNVPAMDATGYPAADGSRITYVSPRGHIDGLILSNDATDPAKDIGIAEGEARDDGNAETLVLSSALIKKLDASWAVGTNAGGLDGTESVAGTPDADTWYHAWLIRRSDTGVVDVLFSESATAPTMPTNYDQKRRIGAVLFDATPDIIGFIQHGDMFRWKTRPLELTTTAPSSTGALVTMSVPLGVKTEILFRWTIYDWTFSYIIFTSPDEDDIAPTHSNADIMTSNAVNGRHTGQTSVISDTSSQLRYRADDATLNTSGLRLFTLGWIDPRGRNA